MPRTLRLEFDHLPYRELSPNASTAFFLFVASGRRPCTEYILVSMFTCEGAKYLFGSSKPVRGAVDSLRWSVDRPIPIDSHPRALLRQRLSRNGTVEIYA